jgi:hypothetical protein
MSNNPDDLEHLLADLQTQTELDALSELQLSVLGFATSDTDDTSDTSDVAAPGSPIISVEALTRLLEAPGWANQSNRSLPIQRQYYRLSDRVHLLRGPGLPLRANTEGLLLEPHVRLGPKLTSVTAAAYGPMSPAPAQWEIHVQAQGMCGCPNMWSIRAADSGSLPLRLVDGRPLPSNWIPSPEAQVQAQLTLWASSSSVVGADRAGGVIAQAAGRNTQAVVSVYGAVPYLNPFTNRGYWRLSAGASIFCPEHPHRSGWEVPVTALLAHDPAAHQSWDFEHVLLTGQLVCTVFPASNDL